MTINSK